MCLPGATVGAPALHDPADIVEIGTSQPTVFPAVCLPEVERVISWRVDHLQASKLDNTRRAACLYSRVHPLMGQDSISV